MNKKLNELLGIEPRANCHNCPNGMCIYQAIEGHEKECEIPVDFQDPENFVLLMFLVSFHLDCNPSDVKNIQEYKDFHIKGALDHIIWLKKAGLSIDKLKQQAQQQTWKR